VAEKIIVVDDDPETLRLVGLMLQRQGYQIAPANNGTIALSLAHTEKPDLILLDIMMPDLDGYQVTQQLRANPETASIPVLMFTAKSQVEDKVIGYEVGADDYLTKPIHPAELVAHVKALLSRRKPRDTTSTTGNRGTTIGLVAARGGIGVSTLTLNLAISYHNLTKDNVIAVELRPGHGSWAYDLGFSEPTGLNNLLQLKPNEITTSAIESELVRTVFGIRMLMASHQIADFHLVNAIPQIQSLLQQLPLMAELVLIDIGDPCLPDLDRAIAFCDEIMVVTEPYPGTVQRTRHLIEELTNKGPGKTKLLSVVVVNRVRAEIQLSLSQIQERVEQPVDIMVPPAPELAYQADIRSTPLINIQPTGLVAQQIEVLAKRIAERIKK